MAIILITHDLGVVAEMCRRVVGHVCRASRRAGAGRELFDDPQHPYTRGLLRFDPAARRHDATQLADIEDRARRCAPAGRLPLRAALRRSRARAARSSRRRRRRRPRTRRCCVSAPLEQARAMSAPLLDVAGPRQALRARRSVTSDGALGDASRRSMASTSTVQRRRDAGLVGESGCGKIHHRPYCPAADRADRGQVVFEGRDIIALCERDCAPFRRAHPDDLPGPLSRRSIRA